jgi:hypothetical protein
MASFQNLVYNVNGSRLDMEMNGIEFGAHQLGVLTFRLKWFSTWPSHFIA